MQTAQQSQSTRERIDTDRAMRERIAGLDGEVPCYGRSSRAYVNLDNAATTPAFKEVRDGVNEFLDWYGSVHRGTGAKAGISTRCFEECRHIVRDFVGADDAAHEAIFTGGATDSINRLAGIFPRKEKPLVICSAMEHHSNLLPWRAGGPVEHIGLRPDGGLDMNELESLFRANKGKVGLVAVTAASNVTGIIPPIREIARMTHKHGAQLLVDAAQRVAHAPITMGAPQDAECIDYLVFSAHKMYAPYGSGALIGPRKLFAQYQPAFSGGGAVELVTEDRVVWTAPPDRHEAGTPNAVGAFALAKSIRVLQEIGMQRIAKHDTELADYTRARLRAIPGLHLMNDVVPSGHGRVGVISFYAENVSHGMLAAALGHEWGIGVRHGCFCAHPYLMRLMKIDMARIDEFIAMAQAGDHGDFPGLVRISLGLYNTEAEVDYAAEAIASILKNGASARYSLDRSTGDYLPLDGRGALDGAFHI